MKLLLFATLCSSLCMQAMHRLSDSEAQSLREMRDALFKQVLKINRQIESCPNNQDALERWQAGVQQLRTMNKVLEQ